ncbi:ABC transporter permease [Nitriliruptoraceae bacterium ZYF776]|nr:ABC transporter permease [Profundirhabdus halotolerans]
MTRTSRDELDRRLPLGRALFAQAALELRLLLRSGESLLVTLGIPLGILVFLSSVEVVPTGDDAAVDFLVPGVLAIATAATGLVAVAIQTAFERKYGVLKRLGGTPLPRAGFLAAKGLAVAAVLAVQTALTLGLALGVLGWEPAGGLLLALPIVVVGAVTMTALGLAMAGALRAEATLALSNALFLVLLLVSGVTFDAGVLPDGLAALGRLLPVGAMGEALRAAFAGTSPWADLAVVAGWGAAAVALATRTFRWEP